MENKYVIVTGGANGIGYGIVDRLKHEGFTPIVLDIVAPKDASGILFEHVDFLNIEESKSVLAKICSKYNVLYLVNNVGIVKPALLEDTTSEDFMTLMGINAQSTLLCLQAILPAMKEAKFGRVVNITSRVVLGKEKRTAYSASKGAIGALTRTWALELAQHGITVNAIAPGPIGTEAFNKNNPPEAEVTKKIINSVPMRRIGTPNDIANTVNFFLSNESSFITGQTLYVCGGLTVGLAD